jgi:molybdopterin converting factor small subunit
MRVEVLLFGPLADAAGGDRVLIETDCDRPTSREVLDALADRRPELRGSLATCRLAVNHAFAADETPVEPGDEVAVIGLVSGG